MNPLTLPLALPLALMLQLAAAPAHAQAGAELAKARGCLACHAVDQRLVGPAFKAVAAKYKGSKEAPAALAAKIIAGGSGAWGQVPMPSNPQVSPPEAAELARWVLAQ